MDLNQLYFDTLLTKSREKKLETLTLHQPEKGIESNVICTAIASEKDLESIQIQAYSDLKNRNSKLCASYEYTLVKMQAGLGSSVKRKDLILEVENRTKLGAKGTDLYFEVSGKLKSIAEIQLLQANALSLSKIYKKVNYKNLVNEETEIAVNDTINKVNFTLECEVQEPYFQKKMPTIDEAGELTTQRMAPAGHGFVGYCEIVDTFTSAEKAEVVAIGNGEDLSSTPDDLMVSWVIENEIPITMITTTKTAADKKGGQISIVHAECPYITIVEKAQAQRSKQLEYFEQLGLRAGDRESLFNTNIVLINKKALKKKFDTFLKDISLEDFLDRFSPDVIQNTKIQSSKNYIQLESALGSVVLNLDRYFRESFGVNLVSFLNLDSSKRKEFFMPIKKREDYDEIYTHYKVDPKTFRLIPK